MRNYHSGKLSIEGGKFMRPIQVPSVVLAASLALAPLLYAQTAPEITLPQGNPARGQAIFESSKGNCLSCHRVSGRGSLFGPDLSAIGAPPRGGGGRGRGGGGEGGGRGGGAAVPPVPAAGPTAEQLAQSILDPNAFVSVQNRYVLLKMKDGKTITGKLLSVDTFAVQIFDSNEKLANISKDNVREMTMTSPMPSYRDKLTTQELADVVSYLMSLRGQ
jgi:mono/diheme cytochrome c family protein